MKGLCLPILLALLVSFAAQAHSQDKPAPCSIVAVYFSPNGGCTQAIIGELEKAKSSVLVQAYSFTSAPIAKALLGAHKRGVKVQVILDKSQRTQKYSAADFLANQGIPTSALTTRL
jgi:phosphatidylserine/phosphatidylglycerophosphate/cardiolipin synthase-like enzyme